MTENKTHLFHQLLPFYKDLNMEETKMLDKAAKFITFHTGDLIHNGENDCTGILVIESGQLRVYILSEEGKEITLYRLMPKELCILSASCILRNINFDIHIDAEKDSTIFLIPTSIYDTLKNQNSAVEKFTNELINERFSNTMWVMEQIVFMSFDKRLAIFLLDQSFLDNTNQLAITHEAIAKHLGTAREVVTRMLKYFQNEGLVSLSRGIIILLDKSKLRNLTT